MIGKLPLNEITIISSAKVIYQYCVVVVVVGICVCLTLCTGKHFVLALCAGFLHTVQTRCNHSNNVCFYYGNHGSHMKHTIQIVEYIYCVQNPLPLLEFLLRPQLISNQSSSE